MYNRKFIRCRSKAVLVLCVIALPFQLAAEQHTKEAVVSFEELRAHAFSKSPLVASIDANYADQLGTAIETGLLQNPEVELAALFPRSYPDERGDNEYGVSLEQPLRISDFGARTTVKNLLEKSATQSQKLELLELSQNLFLQYVRLWALQERRNFIESMGKTAQKKARIVAQARTKGFLGTSEVKLFEGTAARLETDLLGLNSDIAAAESEFTKLANLNLSGRTLKRPHVEAIPSLAEAQSRSKENPLGVKSRIELLERVAEKQSLLARQDAAPGFTPRILYEHTDERKDYIGVGISFELPFFNRNQGEIVRTKAKEREVRVRKQYLEGDGFAAQLENMLRSASVVAEQAKKYETKVFPLFKEALSAAEHQFESGQTSVLQLWQTFGEINSANEELLGLWVKAYGSRSELSLILGEEL